TWATTSSFFFFCSLASLSLNLWLLASSIVFPAMPPPSRMQYLSWCLVMAMPFEAQLRQLLEEDEEVVALTTLATFAVSDDLWFGDLTKFWIRRMTSSELGGIPEAKESFMESNKVGKFRWVAQRSMMDRNWSSLGGPGAQISLLSSVSLVTTSVKFFSVLCVNCIPKASSNILT
ncbi:hypothetical protein C8J56DRAFT_1090376, partial [Mycena floridula]